MENMIIAGTDETPGVSFIVADGLLELSGRSLPEDVTLFYGPIKSWLLSYSECPNEKTTFVFKVDYFNTASSKQLLDILLLLEGIHEKNEGVSIEWFFAEEDEDMEEAGEEFSDLVEIPFKLIEF